jgi:hypothetical protein
MRCPGYHNVADTRLPGHADDDNEIDSQNDNPL